MYYLATILLDKNKNKHLNVINIKIIGFWRKTIIFSMQPDYVVSKTILI